MKKVFLFLAITVPLGLLGWGGVRLYRTALPSAATSIPTTAVKRSDLTFTITARGELRGGNSEMLTAPMTGGSEMHITLLRKPGEVVKAGDTVVEFDTTEQKYKLKEAEADLAEAEQHVIQARAEIQAQQEEDDYALLKAKADVHLAELDVRKNRLVSTITARQNDLSLEAARDRLAQLEHNLANRKATNEASIAIQEAARNKAKVQAETARRNIDSMTLRAHSAGYVAIQQNMQGNFMMFGQMLPMLQMGDSVRGGMAVAQIPDLKNWELSAVVNELDRGHLAAGMKVEISVVALPGRQFSGRIKDLGGTGGPPWERRFDVSITVEHPTPELRPGMTANVVITTDTLHGALWVPAQALFESDGRTFVYVPSSGGFAPVDVTLVRRSESQVALTGVKEGQLVALASPDQQTKKKPAEGAGASQALHK